MLKSFNQTKLSYSGSSIDWKRLSGTHKSLLSAFMCPISAPQAGFEPASDLSTVDRFIQLSYRGDLSYASNNIDNSSISQGLFMRAFARKLVSAAIFILPGSVLVIALLFPSIAKANTVDGLIGHWKLDSASGSTTAVDSSTTGCTGTVSGTSATDDFTSNCARGRCFNVTGTTSYVATGTGCTALNAAMTGVTMSAWVYPRVSNVWHTIIQKGTGGSRQYSYWLSANGTNQLYIEINGSVTQPTVSPVWAVNKWNNVVVTADGTNRISYINGVQANSTANTALPGASNTALDFGYDATTGNYQMNALLDDIRVYNRALTAQEVKDLYLSGKYVNSSYINTARFE